MTDHCPHCGDAVEDGLWHRRCALVVLAALIAKGVTTEGELR